MKKLPNPLNDTELPYCAFGIPLEQQAIVKRTKEDWDKIFDWIASEEN